MVQATFGDVWRDSVEMDDGGRAIDLLPTLKPSPPASADLRHDPVSRRRSSSARAGPGTSLNAEAVAAAPAAMPGVP